jgi:NAD(P)-dependent dehydrogenase (short-subunit alcohol dehydrogenase family)
MAPLQAIWRHRGAGGLPPGATAHPVAVTDDERPVALVTGGASGIGAAICSRLRADGFRLVVFEPDGALAAGAAGGDGLGLAVDVADAAAVERGVAEALGAYGRLDVLVNNAGIGGGPAAGRCHETPYEVWERVQAVNARGPFLCSRAVLPAMLARGSGHVITIASVNSLVVLPGRCTYTTSKGAALMLTRSIAVDYAAHGIRANAVCPGLVRTPLTSSRLDAPGPGGWRVGELVPLGRAGEPDEIAAAVGALAGGELAYMTGAAWLVDGGWTAI